MSAATTTTARRFPFAWRPGRAFYLTILCVLVAAGAATWYRFVYVPAHTTQGSSAVMQINTVRQGDLALSATGSGALIAPAEELGFSAGGEMTVTGMYFKSGDLVKAGDLLAEVDSRQAELSYAESKQKYLDLTSTAAAAAAKRRLPKHSQSLIPPCSSSSTSSARM